MVKDKMERAALNPKAQTGANWMFWLGLLLTAIITVPFVTVSAVDKRAQSIETQAVQQQTIDQLLDEVQELSTELENLK